MNVLPIKPEETYHWLLLKHYARRLPSISFAFGLFEGNDLTGVVTYGMPASPFLCMGVCGKDNKDVVYELNRLCISSNLKNAASILVGRSLQMLPKPMVIVSYADTAQGHCGYVYQACNFVYTGITKERTDMAGEDGKHSRHNHGDRTKRILRSAKHRYVFFVGNASQKKSLKKALNYEVKPYPKGESKRYDAGKDVATQKILFA
jgi:hypothetical protein